MQSKNLNILRLISGRGVGGVGGWGGGWGARENKKKCRNSEIRIRSIFTLK